MRQTLIVIARTSLVPDVWRGCPALSMAPEIAGSAP